MEGRSVDELLPFPKDQQLVFGSPLQSVGLMTTWGVYHRHVCACVICLTSEGVQNVTNAAERFLRLLWLGGRRRGAGCAALT